jgi:DNA-binding transcriptional LysR family regulator
MMAQIPRVRYKDLTLAQLETFCEVCRSGGFSAAARSLNLTTPTVWEQVRALEGQYGVRLLVRRGRRVWPTPEGERLLGMLEPLLAGLESTREAIRQEKGILPMKIRVVSSLRVHMHEIIEAMHEFHRQHPTVQLQIRDAGSVDVIPSVIDGTADLAVMFKPGPGASSSARVVFESIDRLDFLLVTPAGHPLIRKRRLDIADVAKYPLVLGRPEAFSRQRVEEVLLAHNFEGQLSIAIETGSSSLTLAAVRAGLGVGIVVCHPKGVLMRGLSTRSLRRRFGFAQLVFVWKRGALVPPLHQELASLIRSTIRKLAT